MSESDDVFRVSPNYRFVSSAFAEAWESGEVAGVVEGGEVVFEEYDETYGFVGESLPDGTDVRLMRKGQRAFVIREADYQRLQTEKRAARRAEARERRVEQNEKRRAAEEFWKSYQLPFESDVGIKGRVSGLTRGSSGTGRSSRTVEHLLVQEAFSEGRLERDEGEFICRSGSGKFEFSEERRTDGDGESYVPPVTCQSCLELMERWQVE